MQCFAWLSERQQLFLSLTPMLTCTCFQCAAFNVQGQAMLCEAMRATRDLEIRENIVQLLWDLEADQSALCHFEPGELEKKYASVGF